MSERIAITESELLADLRKATQIDEDVPPDAMTVAELCDALGLGPCAISRRLAKYRAEGRLKEYRVIRRDARGSPHPARAYVLLPEAKAQPKLKRA